MNWVFFSLLSRALYAADNIVDKILIEKYIKNSIVLTLLYGIFPLLLSIGIVAVSGFRSIGFLPVVMAIFAGIIQVPAIFAFYQAISKEEISRVIPLFQFTPPFALLLSYLFLKEVLTATYYIAFVLILIGGFLISLQKMKGVLRIRKAFWWMILSSLLYAVQVVILRSLYANYPFWNITTYLGFGEFIPTPIILLFIINFRKRFIRSLSNLKPAGWGLVILAMLLVTGASLSVFWALTSGPASLVSALRGFQSLFVLIYAILFSIWLPKILKEELSRRILGIKAIAIFLMIIGLFLIYR